MLTVRVIPCLDVRDGRVVKGVKFAGLRDAGDPAERARLYAENGADEIVILDVAATIEGRTTQYETIEAVRREVSIPIVAGGGVRGAEHAGRLLASGADKVSINSAAVEDPGLLATLASRYGSQCVVLAIDASQGEDGWIVRTRSGSRELDLGAVDWARRGVERGAGEILLTSFDRDGTREGYDTALLAAVVAAVRAGADAVLAASIFHEGDWSICDLKAELSQAGVEVRPC
jgi:cyclase